MPHQGIPILLGDTRNDRYLVLVGFCLVKRLKVCVPAVVIFFMAVSLFASPVFAQNSAEAAITSAQNNLKTCYEAVEKAQAAGANVDPLAAALNAAADSLSKAQLAYASNDYSSAITYATQSQTALNGVASQASTLQASAANTNTQNILITALSIAASICILSVGVVAWSILNKRGRKS